MPDAPGSRVDPERPAFIESTRVPSPIDEIAEAIADFTEHPGAVYVERFGELWRWSPAHRGGPYPLLRVLARFLGIDYTRLVVPFRTVEDGWTALLPPDVEEGTVPTPDATAILRFKKQATAAEVRERLADLT